MQVTGKNKILRRAGTLALGAAMAVGLVTVPASSAVAEPAGCSHDVYFWTTYSYTKNGTAYYLMHTDSVGSCTTSAYRTLRVEIKADGWPTDPLVAANSSSGTGTSYYAHVQSCDKENYKSYFGRAFFTQSPTYRDSSPRAVRTCY